MLRLGHHGRNDTGFFIADLPVWRETMATNLLLVTRWLKKFQKLYDQTMRGRLFLRPNIDVRGSYTPPRKFI